MKRIIVITLCLATLLFLCLALGSCRLLDLTSLSAVEYTLSEDGTYYILSKAPRDQIGSVRIPSKHKGLPVKEIGASAFSDRSKITKITIPDSVTKIGERAFDSCDKLTNLVIPDSVLIIEDKAFVDCDGIESIHIGAGVKSIGEEVFSYSEALKSISVSKKKRVILCD